MLFPSFSRSDGSDCVSCGKSPYEGIATTVQRQDGQWDHLMICAKCLFTGGISETQWNRFLGKREEPKPIEMPEPIKPRWFDVGGKHE